SVFDVGRRFFIARAALVPFANDNVDGVMAATLTMIRVPRKFVALINCPSVEILTTNGLQSVLLEGVCLRMPTYHIRRAQGELPVGRWDDPLWRQADTVAIDHFYDRSSDHRPRVEARFLWDQRGLHALYNVKDRYVLCRRT